MSSGYNGLLILFDFFFVLSRILRNIRSHRPSNVAFFTFLHDLRWKQFYIHRQNFFWSKCETSWKFSIFSSFGRQLSENSGYAGSEHQVQTHLTEPPCACKDWCLTFKTSKSSLKLLRHLYNVVINNLKDFFR